MNRYCVSKKVIFPGIFILMLVVYTLFSSSVTRNKIIVQNKAAPSKLIGGVEAGKGEYPAVALLRNTIKCTGTLIAPQWIVTAAHCVNSPLTTYAAVGIVEVSDFESNKVEIIDIIIHKEYNLDNAYSNDIALLLLEKEIPDVPLPLLPQLPRDNYMYNIDTLVHLVGFGCTAILPTPGSTIMPVYKDGNYFVKYPGILQRLTLPIFSSQTSEDQPNGFVYGYYDERSLTHTTCWGDSGGPVFFKKGSDSYLIGIHSLGTSSILIAPSQGSKVINFTDWIQATIDTHVPPTPTPANGEWIRCDNNSTSCNAFCRSKQRKCWGAREREDSITLKYGECSQTNSNYKVGMLFSDVCNLSFNTYCYCSPLIDRNE